MAILSNRGIKYKGLVMNSKKVLIPDFYVFYKFQKSNEICPKKNLKKYIFFFDLCPFRRIYSKKFTNFRRYIISTILNLEKRVWVT